MGLFELADGGTLFLDEIGDMPLYSQVKLLRILEEKKVTRIGAVTPRQVDFRLITATNRDLVRMVAEETFREDLYYRINMLNIRLPALCERAEDILPLARHILSTIGYPGLDFTPAASAAMRAYGWPGNVRQLFNSLVRASIHDAGKGIDLTDLPAEIPDRDAGEGNAKEAGKEARRSRRLTDYMASQEAGYITSRLIENKGNISLTAQELRRLAGDALRQAQKIRHQRRPAGRGRAGPGPRRGRERLTALESLPCQRRDKREGRLPIALLPSFRASPPAWRRGSAGAQKRRGRFPY